MKAARVELVEANLFVDIVHRHHKPVRGHRYTVGAEHGGKLVGVATVGRPVARAVDQKFVAEVLRLATDGTKNACSFLYAKAAQVAELLGFREIQTYILDTETGTSLKAAGWECVGQTAGGSWNCPSRGGRREDQPQNPKTKWRKILG
jgi:L-amino acid N-acyltransferase YncA